MKTSHTPASLYLSWVNDFVSVDAFASYYGLTRDEALATIETGRTAHEARAAIAKTAHTPGPWIAIASKTDAGHWQIQKQISADKIYPSWAIALIPNCQNSDEANARLIAAAPALLAELEAASLAIRDLSKQLADLGVVPDAGWRAFRQARATLATAKPQGLK